MSILFLEKDKRIPVDGTVNIREISSKSGIWEGEVQKDGNVQIYIRPVRINADKLKYLYIAVNGANIEKIRVCFSKGLYMTLPDEEDLYSENLSFSTQIGRLNEDATLVLDLRRAEKWEGEIASLRLHFIGTKATDRIKILSIGFSELLEINPKDTKYILSEIVQQKAPAFSRRDRMAAYHETVVAVDSDRPNAEIRTWASLQKNTVHMLMKISPFIIIGKEIKGPAFAAGLKVRDFPGGVKADYSIEHVNIEIKLMPLLLKGEIEKREGFALYHIKTSPKVPMILEIGGGKEYNFFLGESSLRHENFSGGNTEIEFMDEKALLWHDSRTILTAVRSEGKLEILENQGRGRRLGLWFGMGEGYFITGFGEDKDELYSKLSNIDRVIEEEKVEKHYMQLLKNSIKTPESGLDQTFRDAVCNLEYSWYQPFGWIETIREFLMMFHQQHTASADWLGQYERSRKCLEASIGLIAADKILEPVQPDGGTCGSFGGENQFFTWEARHHFRHTNDVEFIKKAADAMDKIISKTFCQFDTDNDLLLGWNAQIANQEDYSMHPNNSTSPSIEGINMFRLRISLAEALGDEKTAERYKMLLAMAYKNLKDILWKKDLGRFIFYSDFMGKKHLDGQYHTYAFPLIWEITDALDSYTSIRHLCDRLTGLNGEVYTNNNFPCHGWGAMQLAVVQPWASLAFAYAGKNNDAIRPLLNVARWTAEKEGSFPEAAGGKDPNYFSPSAALFVTGMIEAVFGLDYNLPKSCIDIRPSFPDHWPEASLSLPCLSAVYKRSGNHISYEINTAKSIKRNFRWILPPSKIINLIINGKPVDDFKIEPLVSKIAVILSTQISESTFIEFDMEPVEYSVEYDLSIAEGSMLTVSLNGFTITGIDDRCSLIKSFSMQEDNKLKAVIKEGLLNEYKGFGRLGKINFSRRTFFLKCSSGDIQFWHPVDLTILPPYEACQAGHIEIYENYMVFSLLLRNNTGTRSKGRAAILLHQNSFSFDVDLEPRSEEVFKITLFDNFIMNLNSGDNVCKLVMPDKNCIEFVIDASTISWKDQGNSTIDSKEIIEKFLMIPIPESDTIDHSDWKKMRNSYIFGCSPYCGVINPLEALYGEEISVEGLPISFLNPNGKFIPISFRLGRPSYKLDLKGIKLKKLYLLILSFVENHDVFSVVGNITAMRKDDGCISKVLYFPGDVDGFYPEEAVGIRATAHGKKRHRHRLLSLIKAGDADYMEGKPDEVDSGFPRPEYWCDSRVLKTPAAVMNIIELDLGGAFEMEFLMLSSVGTEPAFGLVAVTGEI